MKCFLHSCRPATRALNIPCASGGKLWVCDECFNAAPDSKLRKLLFDAYALSHADPIAQQRALDAVRKIGQN